MTGVAPGVRTHSVRWVEDAYAGTAGWQCRGCGERWWTEHHDKTDIEQQPCGTRAPDPGSEGPR